MCCKVVNIKDLPGDWESDTNIVYIGRRGRGHDGYFGNPFRIQPGSPRGSSIEKYVEYFYYRIETDPEFKAAIHNLEGKTLACFCAPLPCHGHVIAQYLDNLSPPPTS
jgi:hypothetical protein